MPFDIMKPGIGSVVWVDTPEYPRWPGKICIPKNKFSVREGCFRVLLLGVHKSVWIPKKEVRAYRYSGNFMDSSEINQDWIKAVQEAENITRGIKLTSYSSYRRQEASVPKNTPGTSYLPKPACKEIEIANCCGVPKSGKSTLPKSAQKKKSPIVMIDRLPDVVLDAKRIWPVNHKDCVGSCKPIPPDDNGKYTHVCFKCELKTEQVKRKSILGIFDSTGEHGLDIITSLSKKNELYVWDENFDCRQSLEIERQQGVYTMKSVDLFVNTCDTYISCAPNIKIVRETLLTRVDTYPYVCKGKSYVFFTPMDLKECLDIAEVITRGGGRFLEACLVSKHKPNDPFQEQNFLVTSGDKSLFEDFRHQLYDVSKNLIYLGAPGKATKMRLVLNCMVGSLIGCFLDVWEFAEQFDMIDPSHKHIFDLLNSMAISPFNNQMFTHFETYIQNPNKDLPKNIQDNLQKGIKFALQNGECLPVVTASRDYMIRRKKKRH